MNLGRFFQRLALYRASRHVPLWVLVALAVGFYLLAGIGEAHAGISSQTFASRSEASATCEQSRALVEGYTANQRTWCEYLPDLFHSAGDAAYRCMREVATGGPDYGCGSQSHPSAISSHYFDYGNNDGCPTGETWNEATRTCGEPPPTEEECLNRNDAINSNSVMGGQLNGSCVSGCKVGAQPGTDSAEVTYDIGGTVLQFFQGNLGYTGETCSDPSQPAPDFTKPEECAQIAGQTVCVTAGGQHCYSIKAGSATKNCWWPGQTGEKANGDTLQVREPGDKTAAPTPPTPPPGETLSQTGTPVKGTAVVNNTTINTTTTNYQTGGGTDARPGTGTGTGEGTGEGDGDGDDDEPNSVSGDGSCGGAGLVATGDAILGAILGEVWKARCIAEGGGDDPGEAPTGGEGSDPGDTNVIVEGEVVDGSTLDFSGFGGGSSCIGFVDGGSSDGIASGFMATLSSPPPMWCNYIDWLKAMFILLATVTGIYIISGRNI